LRNADEGLRLTPKSDLHEFATLAQDVQTCYDIICRANKKLELELETVGRENHDKNLGFRKWKAEAKELGINLKCTDSKLTSCVSRLGKPFRDLEILLLEPIVYTIKHESGLQATGFINVLQLRKTMIQ